MSNAYKCDICETYIDTASPSKVEEQKSVIFSGVKTNIKLNVDIDCFEKPEPHHVCNDCWKVVLLKIAAYLEARYS